jgi:hypothetical protein
MKKFLLALIVMLFSSVLYLGCQENSINNPAENEINRLYSLGSGKMGHYDVELISVTKVGDNYEWLYGITNYNPGSKNQDLSHWGIKFICEDYNIEDYIVKAEYGFDEENLTSFNFKYVPDGKGNWDCVGEDAYLKFDFGTTGTQTSYYKITLSENFGVGTVQAVYKSGKKGDCGRGFEIPGPDCGTVECDQETAFAVGELCFLEAGFNRWGWRLGPVTESGNYDIYAGAGKCVTSKGTYVGELKIDLTAKTVTYELNTEFVEVHLYVSDVPFPTVNGKYTVAPGQYNYTTPDDVSGHTITFNVDATNKYVIAHAVVKVCKVEDPE